MSVFDGQEPHIKVKADRILDLFRVALQGAKGDRDVALLYMCGFLTHARDYIIEKTGMHPNTAERDIQENASKAGYELATSLLVEDFSKWKESHAEVAPESNIVLAPG